MDTFPNLKDATGAPDDPMELFEQWLADAGKSEPDDPNAMAVATIDAENRPSVRILLLKGWDDQGFVFYTNRESSKGLALAAHPLAALCFYWKTLGRQIRIDGSVERVSDAESDDYYNSRPIGSRIGAWASRQSRPLENRMELIDRVNEFTNKYHDQESIPRPPHWGGYRVIPRTIEFWHAGESRLHTRVLYTKTGDGWSRQMLYP
jgi:pyridoxamine 5'-phosphate oxidase